MRIVILEVVCVVMAVLAAGCMVSNREYQAVKDQLAAKEELLGKVSTARDEATRQLKEAQEAGKAAEQNASDMTAAMKQKEADLARAKANLETITKERDLLKAQLSKANAAAEVARKDAAEKQAALDGLNEKIADLQAKLDAARQEVERLKKGAEGGAKQE
ncbi:MAG: hypothetical protein AB1696_01705 [Planctomycetota bacterium]